MQTGSKIALIIVLVVIMAVLGFKTTSRQEPAPTRPLNGLPSHVNAR